MSKVLPATFFPDTVYIKDTLKSVNVFTQLPNYEVTFCYRTYFINKRSIVRPVSQLVCSFGFSRQETCLSLYTTWKNRSSSAAASSLAKGNLSGLHSWTNGFTYLRRGLWLLPVSGDLQQWWSSTTHLMRRWAWRWRSLDRRCRYIQETCRVIWVIVMHKQFVRLKQ